MFFLTHTRYDKLYKRGIIIQTTEEELFLEHIHRNLGHVIYICQDYTIQYYNLRMERRWKPSGITNTAIFNDSTVLLIYKSYIKF